MDETRRAVKMFLIPKNHPEPMSDAMVPDYLVTDQMIVRYLEIEPPSFAVIPEFQEIVGEIEVAYVTGRFFSAVSSACVSIERLLNLARMELHKYHPKIKDLWGKGPSNEWYENIDALKNWGYIDNAFAAELAEMYKEIRCRYLHSGAITNLALDAKKSVVAAYRLLSIFLGFPPELFAFEGAIVCKNEDDPRFKAFYLPNRRSE
jgi:hypothetical protein